MRVVLQRVRYASCTIDGVVHGKIDDGFLALVGITQSDNEEIVKKVAKKCAGFFTKKLQNVQNYILLNKSS